MSKNNNSKIWYIIAIGFMVSGILDKNMTFVTLGCAFICIGSSNEKRQKENQQENTKG